jgi:hypothetical protein
MDRNDSYIILITEWNFKCFKIENEELVLEKINTQDCGNIKLCLLWLEQTISQNLNKRTYLISSQNLEYITALL